METSLSIQDLRKGVMAKKKDNLPIVSEPVEEITTDFTAKDEEKITKFIESGRPGFATLEESKLLRCMDLYLEGMRYDQISGIMKMKKDLIMYLGKKFNWFEARQEYLMLAEENMRRKLVEAKLKNQEFLLSFTTAWQRKMYKNLNDYHRTGDSSHMNNIDLKEFDRYLKTIDTLYKLSQDPSKFMTSKEQAPTFGLNVSEGGVNVTKTGENSFDITPKAAIAGSMISQLAELKRQEEQERLEESKIRDVTNKEKK